MYMYIHIHIHIHDVYALERECAYSARWESVLLLCIILCVILWFSMCSAIYKCMYCLLLHFLSFSSLNLATFSLFCYADHFIFVLRSFLQGDVIFFKSFIFQ